MRVPWPLFNRLLLNDGQGGFIASSLGAVPDAPIRLHWPISMATSNDAPDRKLAHLNDGKGHFTEFGTFGDPKWSTRYVKPADLGRQPGTAHSNTIPRANQITRMEEFFEQAYNRQRPHSLLCYLTPVEFEQATEAPESRGMTESVGNQKQNTLTGA